tara:strand:- start:133088 stop:133987 length:900 start_codon:yes stop_codon:yes gene_type:complete
MSSLTNKYKPPKDRLYIRRAFAWLFKMSPNHKFIAKMALKLIVISGSVSKVPVLSWVYKKIILMSKNDHSQGYNLPLNVSISKDDELKQIVLPIDLMKKAVVDASYRAILTTCICRETRGCKEYPTNFGCIFLGTNALRCVENGIAKEATIEDCHQHIDKAKSLGLSGQALWVEVEKYIWGWDIQKVDHVMELCFCCPCCCTAFKFAEKADEHIKSIYHRPTGWLATVDEAECINCECCYKVCPLGGIDLLDECVQTNDHCTGCGLCVEECPTEAIKIENFGNTKSDIREYFSSIDFKI